MKYTFTNQALDDLDLIWQHTFEKWSLDQADRYIQLLFKTFDWITINYNSCKNCKEIHSGLKRWKTGRHFIFFEILSSDQIEIVRVLHEQMDIVKQFSD